MHGENRFYSSSSFQERFHRFWLFTWLFLFACSVNTVINKIPILQIKTNFWLTFIHCSNEFIHSFIDLNLMAVFINYMQIKEKKHHVHTFISKARVKLAKNLANAKQHSDVDFCYSGAPVIWKSFTFFLYMIIQDQ